MTPLRARFIAHLNLKGYSAKTQKNYLQPIIQFSKWLKRSGGLHRRDKNTETKCSPEEERPEGERPNSNF